MSIAVHEADHTVRIAGVGFRIHDNLFACDDGAAAVNAHVAEMIAAETKRLSDWLRYFISHGSPWEKECSERALSGMSVAEFTGATSRPSRTGAERTEEKE